MKDLYIYIIIGLALGPNICQCNENKNEVTNTNANKKDIAQLSEQKNDLKGSDGCVILDGLCIAPSDVSSYEAIKALHAHLDDDQSGDIDFSESVDFLREELNYTKGFEKRQKAFHHNNDQHVSVHELWTLWLANEVHNWTVEQTVGWLYVCVELGQYADVFYENAINGSLLPRLATNNDHFLKILGIKNPTHRSKISIKAMDIVLFGPPKETGSLMKDMFIASLIFVIVVMGFKFNHMNRQNSIVHKKMNQDMEILHEELRRFRDEKLRDVDTSKEKRRQSKAGGGGGGGGGGEEEGGGEKGEEEDVNSGEEIPPPSQTPWDDDGSLSLSTDYPLEWDACTVMSDVPELDLRSKNELQLWMQLTYEMEQAVLVSKNQALSHKFEEAGEMLERTKPNRRNLFGALSFIHGKIESKGQPVIQLRAGLTELKMMKEEMDLRWNALERLLSFNIKQNPGLESLRLRLEYPLQASKVHHTPNTAVGLTNAEIERGTESPGVVCRLSSPEDLMRKRNFAHMRGSSVASTISLESSCSSNLRTYSNSYSRKHQQASPFLQQSHTIGSGLSNYASEKYRPRSSSSESKLRKISTVSQPAANTDNSASANANELGVDETDKMNFTIGESNVIKIDSNSAHSVVQLRCSPSHSQSASPLQETAREKSLRNSAVEQVRTQRKRRLHLLGKSYSQDENGGHETSPEKTIGKGKYSSEPTLEIQQSPSSTPDQDNLTKPFHRKGILSRSKLFSKFKKNDKNK